MQDHYSLSDVEFTDQFKKAILDPKLFSHDAHLRLAWIYINNDGLDLAIKQITHELKGFVTSLGAIDKYNETVTVAAIKAVYHFWLKSDSKTFQDFILENPRLKTNFKALLASHYDIEIFNSKTAKSSFLEPTLLPFD
ncbi:hypothetical protein [Flavivirga eckloniae]|uniref:Uncharacterized protein n=1 Tax=Flavivirga eckloniae TaxID=1803846 RepID=A0A2K9PW97_9FLAO|nr:hypothetical protein [Flavivirga eckloniae]AUP81108.1 hypothetical protein C1H87_21285 [Flavivirga eckloniae]